MTSANPSIKRRAYDAGIAQSISGRCGNSALGRLYASRGVEEGTLEAGPSLLPAKETLEGAGEAAAMLAEAVTGGKKIIILGDYDADGATSTALMLRALRATGANCDFIVPDREKHGYGISPLLARMAKERGADMILTVDNGIAAHAGIKEAKDLGLSVCVTDHHLQADTLPDADVIVNPNMKGSRFATRNLAGVGVAFYVIGMLRDELLRRGHGRQINMASLLDLVAIGTVGDMVRLDQTNRSLVRMGIDRIREGRANIGIQSLLSVTKRINEKVNAETLGFVLAPRINAAGRLKTADIGIQMLATEDLDEALRLASDLDRINQERKEKQAEMTGMALEMLEEFDFTGRNSVVVHDPSFHEGVIGLVASRLKDKFNRPAAAFALAHDGSLKASLRSIDGIHIRDVLDLVAARNPGLLVKFGGHAGAAGATIVGNGLLRFEEAFEKAVNDFALDGVFDQVVWTDGELTKSELSMQTAEMILRENWGQGFPAPLFEGKFRAIEQKIVGSGHLKLKLDLGGTSFDGMFFGQKERISNDVNALYKLDINEYRGNRTVQLMVQGIQ